MTYYHLLSVRDLLDFLLDAINLNNKIINYEYIIKTYIFFNENFVERDLHKKEYKLKLFKIITDTILSLHLDSMKNCLLKCLIQITDPNDEEELSNLFQFLIDKKNKVQIDSPFGKRGSGTIFIESNIFKKLEDLLVSKFWEGLTHENLVRLEILLLESEAFSIEEKEHITQAFTKRVFKFLPESREKVTNGIKYPRMAWDLITEYSNKKNFNKINTYVFEGFFRPNLVKKLINYISHINIYILFNNALSHNNNEFLFALIKYSSLCMNNNEETLEMWEKSLKLYSGHTFDKHTKMDQKVIDLLLLNIYRIKKILKNKIIYEELCQNDRHLENSLDNYLGNSFDNSDTK
jgi:hypothetical protein